MYDHLNAVDVCLSNNRSLVVTKTTGGHFSDILQKLAATGQRRLFIGDNLNIAVGVAQQRIGHHKHMVHMFTSAALVSDHYFRTMAQVPEIPLHLLQVSHVVLPETEYREVKKDCVSHWEDHCWQSTTSGIHKKAVFPKDLAGENGEAFAKKLM